ncbi:SMC-Scp complex subunit ScpB [Rubrivirga sp.]|uniref:SMC-Scp complex subunit ScpB n=1 Tax=Rubrivirga sp. TaxID=1885344 RepID=UPI003C7587C4
MTERSPEDFVSDTFDQAVESLVFASDVPLREEDVARCYSEVTGVEVSSEQVGHSVDRLNVSYQEGGRAFRIRRWAGGLRMATIDEVSAFPAALFEDDATRRLSKSLLETLSVIAYKQPVTRAEIDHVRGVGSDYAVRQLLERDFITISGRGEGVGRPLLYATTERFLDQFGLEATSDLPAPREIEELLADPAFNRERARLLADLASPSPNTEATNE